MPFAISIDEAVTPRREFKSRIAFSARSRETFVWSSGFTIFWRVICAAWGWVLGGVRMKKFLAAALATMLLSGCIFDEEAWDFHDTSFNVETGRDK